MNNISSMCLLYFLWNSLSRALNIFQEGKSNGKDKLKLEAQALKSEVCTTCHVCALSLEPRGILFYLHHLFIFLIPPMYRRKKGKELQ